MAYAAADDFDFHIEIEHSPSTVHPSVTLGATLGDCLRSLDRGAPSNPIQRDLVSLARNAVRELRAYGGSPEYPRRELDRIDIWLSIIDTMDTLRAPARTKKATTFWQRILRRQRA